MNLPANDLIYNTHGHKWRIPPSKKAQFVTECDITAKTAKPFIHGEESMIKRISTACLIKNFTFAMDSQAKNLIKKKVNYAALCSLLLLFLLLGCTVPPVVTTTPSPSTGPTVDPNDAPYLPNPAWQPGAYNPDVTPDTIQTTICVSGYSSKIRPPVSYTDNLKVQQIKQYGYTDTNLADYEEDHLIPLAVGGDPKDPKNLWPQPRNTSPYNASVKDTLEDTLHRMVCSGQVPLDTARQDIARDWVAAYHKYVGQSIIIVTGIPTEP